jgi:aldose 1-epimerase
LIGESELDTGFTSLVRGTDGIARVEVDNPETLSGVTLWADEGFKYLMVFTGDTLSPKEARRRSVAVEPMTCPPNALRSGVDLIRLAPGAPWKAAWGITPRH